MKRLLAAMTLTSVFFGCGGKPAEKPLAKTESPASPATTAIAQNPTLAGQRSAAELIVAADQFIAQLDLNNAVLALNEAIEVDPRNSEAYIKRSAVFAEAKLFTRAANDMGIAIQLDPKSAKLRNTRGYFHLLRKDYDLAEADFNAAIDLNPQYPQALNNRGLVFIAIDKQVQAANDFKRAIELKPDYIDAYNNLGYISVEMELYDEAVASLTKAVELDSSYVNALTNRGRAYVKLKNYDAAIQDFTVAIKLQPDNMQYYAHRSEAYQASGQDALALADYQYIGWFQKLKGYNAQIANTPQDAAVWVARGRHLMIEKEFEAAHSSFDKALQAQPAFAEAYVGKAAIHTLLKEYDLVIEQCTKAITIKALPEAYSLRADAYFETHQLDQAITDYKAAKRIDSQVVKAYETRSAEYQKAGNVELANLDQAEAQVIKQSISQIGQVDQGEQLKPRAMQIQQVNHEETVTQ